MRALPGEYNAAGTRQIADARPWWRERPVRISGWNDTEVLDPPQAERAIP